MSVSTPTEPPSSPAPANAAAPTTTAQPAPAPAAPEDSVYAIVEAAGQQVWLQPNRYLDLNRLDAAVDSTITLETVLLLKDGNRATLGQPYVPGARVELTVLAHRRGPKILVYKMRRKKKTRRKTGHRQELTRVLVRAIHSGS